MKTAKPAEEKKTTKTRQCIHHSTTDGQSTCRDSRQSGQTIAMKDNKTDETSICLPWIVDRLLGRLQMTKFHVARLGKSVYTITQAQYNTKVEERVS